jgi:hypothetical protein
VTVSRGEKKPPELMVLTGEVLKIKHLHENIKFVSTTNRVIPVIIIFSFPIGNKFKEILLKQ